jgi:hypothetical protein
VVHFVIDGERGEFFNYGKLRMVIARTVARTPSSAEITASLRSCVNVPIPHKDGGYVPRKAI